MPDGLHGKAAPALPASCHPRCPHGTRAPRVDAPIWLAAARPHSYACWRVVRAHADGRTIRPSHDPLARRWPECQEEDVGHGDVAAIVVRASEDAERGG